MPDVSGIYREFLQLHLRFQEYKYGFVTGALGGETLSTSSDIYM